MVKDLELEVVRRAASEKLDAAMRRVAPSAGRAKIKKGVNRGGTKYKRTFSVAAFKSAVEALPEKAALDSANVVGADAFKALRDSRGIGPAHPPIVLHRINGRGIIGK